jgi:hypothetical protein
LQSRPPNLRFSEKLQSGFVRRNSYRGELKMAVMKEKPLKMTWRLYGKMVRHLATAESILKSLTMRRNRAIILSDMTAPLPIRDVHDLFDRTLKHLITVPDSVITGAIKIMFDTDFPLKSEVTFENVEEVNENRDKPDISVDDHIVWIIWDGKSVE